MAHTKLIPHLQKLLLQFLSESDLVLATLQWLIEQMMQVEAQAKAGAPKGKHSSERKTHFSGSRVWGTMTGSSLRRS